jgi:tRNA (guanine37-N1)-methyltransferase
MVGRAIEVEALALHLEDLRSHGLGKHRTVDDSPYGGGSGMVLRVDPVVHALEAVDELAESRGAPRAHRILLTPGGARFDQRAAHRLAAVPHLALVCGRYEGFDERTRHFVHEELSLGDFVMTGGEIAAMAIVEATARLLPNVLGNEHSHASESFSPELDGGLEYPHYTRPVDFRGLSVPVVLTSGDHAKIAAWRLAESRLRTRTVRPDLAASLDPEES